MDIDELIPLVFKTPAPEPFQYDLMIDHDTQSEPLTEHDIFQALGQILTHGLEFLFGADVDLATLDERQIQHVQQCMAGLGYKILINPNAQEQALPRVIPYFLKLPCPPGQTIQYISIAFQALR